MNLNDVGIYELYRHLTVREILAKKNPNERILKVINPALKWFPKLADNTELWRTFVSKWKQKLSKFSRKERSNVIFCEEKLAELICDMWPILFALSMPQKDYQEESMVGVLLSMLTPCCRLVDNCSSNKV